MKDLIDMKGVVTSAGSKYIATSNPPAVADARCLAIARERNVQFVGKTNLSELALSPSGFNEYYGTPVNPISRRHQFFPGGSSSGSAVAVASGFADVAFGTDSTGSIRLPAACCGVVGLKTTFGLVNLKGVYPVDAVHLDTVGALAKDIARTVEGMDLLQRGFVERYHEATAVKPVGEQIRVGRLYLDGTDPKIDEAIDDALARAHFKVVRLSDSFKAAWAQAQKDTASIAAASAWINDAKYRTDTGISARTRAVLLLGKIEWPGAYRAALRRQSQWKAAIRHELQKVDFIATPTVQGIPPKLSLLSASPLFESTILIFQNTAAVNLAGNPALAIPAPLFGQQVPVTSLQLVGKPLSEAALLNAGRLVEIANRGAIRKH